jgi:hypothetical protein
MPHSNAPGTAAPRGRWRSRLPLRFRPASLLARRLVLSIASTATLYVAHVAQAAPADTETLVFVRHGEKPAKGYGQLDCQGLNRALALPAVIAAKFGKPDAVYAPNPSMQKKDEGVRYDYVRPLATIEPTAIQFALPVDTTYGYSQIDALEHELVNPKHRGKLIVTAWEHHEIEDLVRNVIDRYGDKRQQVPAWHSDDFDSIYVVKLEWNGQGDAPRATFVVDREGLNGRAQDCPCAALPDAAADSGGNSGSGG